MRNTLRQVFHSPKFVIGFVIIMVIILTTIIYPMVSPGDPLYFIGQGSDKGSFIPPGTYISLYDASSTWSANLYPQDADAKRLGAVLSDEDRTSMLTWLEAAGVDISGLDASDTDALLETWTANYDESIKPSGMTKAQRNYYKRLNNGLKNMANGDLIIATEGEDGALTQKTTISANQYVAVGAIANVVRLPLGTDNFGRDMVRELISAIGTSLLIGLVAGSIATFIGLLLGLLSGYVGGWVDDVIMFVTNLFTVIPSFILLILINYSLGQEARGAMVVAVVIGLTSWTWTTRSVRSQVISLRNRDHVNLSKLSGHSLLRIVITDILPYVASYVVMAFILQISSAILSEAQLSMLGLGPSTTKSATLGLMMNWAMLYSAHLGGYWWAYFPVVAVIALISFSLNLMNTGLDQVFNPTLRD